ncbi:NADP-dependent oxidoreductase [Streptomyces sp. MZ04]|uniref:NADP-dependent oxidoreductase n=1 Tax=Streptomyces sp. MZ04 TaxID=2559236 RepID=UPI00107E6C1F|nr:NADP-dependent oxidoreductase [Streptomyces sp. MZ04]TGB07631.1 NADP-dependent oxidoreductase [Streptomyces sp. MZ04]
MRAVAVRKFKAEPELMEVPDPAPGPGEVLVRVDYASLNPFDWQAADGVFEGLVPHVFPLIMGIDFAGRVDAIGPGQERFRIGDPVFGQAIRPPVGAGTYAEFVTMPQDAVISTVPLGLSMESAAVLPTAGMTAAQILETAGIRECESLLIVGATGGVGTQLTQLAADREVRVLAAVRGDEKHRMGALGAAVTIDSTSRDLADAVRDAYPEGVDAVVDLVSGDPDSFAAHAALVRDGGVALSARSAGAPAKAPHPPGVEVINFDLRAGSELLDILAAAAVKGVLNAPVEAEVPLEKAPRAIARNRAGGARGKTVLVL